MNSGKPVMAGSKNKRRRKRARTEDFSSDSSDDSSNSESEIHEKSDSENDLLDIDIELKDDNNEQEEEYIYRAEKLRIPKELIDSSSSNQHINDEFQEYYRQLMTMEFGDDLNELQKSKDFQNTSLFLLVKALEEGANIFDEKQRREILRGKEEERS